MDWDTWLICNAIATYCWYGGTIRVTYTIPQYDAMCATRNKAIDTIASSTITPERLHYNRTGMIALARSYTRLYS